MRARDDGRVDVWELDRPAPVEEGPLRLRERAVPAPGPGEVLVRVSACGVCRTDLHVCEGDLPVRRPHVVPGHEVVGVVAARGEGVGRFAEGERIGIAWLRWTCGACRFCARGDENLCVAPRFTGWDEDGGYASHAVVDERYAYGIPDVFDDLHAAPLLCAGIIGYRALRRARVPANGSLGIYGFGGSAHLACQVAVSEGARVHVFTRSERAQELALELGAATAGKPGVRLRESLDAAVLFAPSGDLVPVALSALAPGGRLAIAGIHLSGIPGLVYAEHLFMEREIVSVTANTRRDGEEFLAVAASIPVSVSAIPYEFADAPRALADLKKGRVRGAAVIRTGTSGRARP